MDSFAPYKHLGEDKIMNVRINTENNFNTLNNNNNDFVYKDIPNTQIAIKDNAKQIIS